jgi:ABC-2 type transport system permease protein
MNLGRILTVAARLIRQVLRDRRLLAMLFLAPVVVMVLIALVIRQEDRTYALGLHAKGPMALFTGDLIVTLEKAGFAVEEVMDESSPRELVRSGELDGVLIMGENFLVERAKGNAGKLTLLLEGADPMAEVGLAEDLNEAVADMMGAMPVLLDADCPAICAKGVNLTPPQIDIVRVSGQGLDMVDFFLPGIIPLVAFFFGFILTSLSFLRERSGGTLERLLASPIRRQEIIAGYFLGFLLFGLLQSAVIVSIAVWVLEAPNQAGLAPLTGLLVLSVATAAGLGLFLSTFAKTEFQVVQFIPLVILPQMFLCGLIWPVEQLPSFLQPVAWSLPLTYAVDAAREMMIRGDLSAAGMSVLGLAGFCIATVILASVTLRRRVM